MRIRRVLSIVCLVLSTLLFTSVATLPASAGQFQVAPPSLPEVGGQATSGAPRDVTVTFVQGPRHRRARNEASLRLSEYVIVEAVAAVRDEARRPMSGVAVTLSALSDGGVFKSGRGRTDARGEAAIEIRFDLPPGSLGLAVRACLSENAEPCTPIERISLRDWVDFELSLDAAILTASLPEEIQRLSFPSLNREFQMIGVAAVRPQVNLWEAEHEWRYYRVSLYGHVPLVAHDHGVGYSFSLPFTTPTVNNYESLDATAGLGDWSAGLNVVLGGVLFGDVAYNSRSGKVNLVDSVQRFSELRLVNLGDGFESIDSAIEARTFVQPDDLFLFARYENAHVLRRTLSFDRVATRGDAHDVIGGLGLVVGQDSAMLVWGGYRRAGEFRLTRRGRLVGRLRAEGEYLVGLTRVVLTRRRARPAFGFTAGGLGTETTYIGLSFSVSFDAL